MNHWTGHRGCATPSRAHRAHFNGAEDHRCRVRFVQSRISSRKREAEFELIKSLDRLDYWTSTQGPAACIVGLVGCGSGPSVCDLKRRSRALDARNETRPQEDVRLERPSRRTVWIFDCDLGRWERDNLKTRVGPSKRAYGQRYRTPPFLPSTSLRTLDRRTASAGSIECG